MKEKNAVLRKLQTLQTEAQELDLEEELELKIASVTLKTSDVERCVDESRRKWT